MDKILYSIIIPHKNLPELLQRCLDSIPVRDDVEVIVVDDNSDNNVVDFDNFPKWNGTYHCIYTKNGKGAGYARNIGLEHAKGNWILFADCDDFYSTSNLGALLNNTKTKDYDVIIWPTQTCLADKTEYTHVPYEKTYGGYNYSLIGLKDILPCYIEDILYRLYQPWHKMVKSELIRKHHIRFSEIPFCNDLMFSVVLASKTQNIGVYTDVIYQYCKRNGSLSEPTNKNIKNIILRFEELIRVQGYLHKFRKTQYLKFSYAFLSAHSFLSALRLSILQIRLVSLKVGGYSLIRILLYKPYHYFRRK